MTDTHALLSRDEESVKETTAPRPTDDLAPLAPERTSAAHLEIRTLVQHLAAAQLADSVLAQLMNEGWEVLDVSVNTVIEYMHDFLKGEISTLHTVRTVTLMRLLDGDDSSREADATADAATVQIPQIILTPPEPDHAHLKRTIVGRGVTFAQASADGTYTEGELDALRQFEQMAAFVPGRTQ